MRGKLKQETTLEKLKKGKDVTDSRLTMRIKDGLYPLMMALTATKVKYKVEAVNKLRPIEGKPIIFAPNHSAFTDTPIVLKNTGRRSYIFAGRQRLYLIDWLFFVINGVIWVDRKSKEDMKASKAALTEYLNKGRSVLWFPEGTWNLTDNLLMLNMKWGIIDIARETGAQIIPIALDYDRKNKLCRLKYGEPMADEALEDSALGIRMLRDRMATLKWDLMCNNRAEDINIEKMKEDVLASIKEYPPLDWEYESSVVFCPYEEAFAHLDKLIPSKENAFLFRKR